MLYYKHNSNLNELKSNPSENVDSTVLSFYMFESKIELGSQIYISTHAGVLFGQIYRIDELGTMKFKVFNTHSLI